MKIKFINGDRKGESLEFPLSEVTIGREDCNILRLTTEGVSRFHATLRQTPDRGWIIIDHDSTNGVKVNGVTITGMQTVFDGDAVTIGEQQFTLEELNPTSPVVEFKPILTTGPATVSATSAAAPGTSVKSVEDSVAEDKKESDKIAEDFLKQLSSSADGLFKKSEKPASAGNDDKVSGGKKRRSMRFNIIFYGALVFLLVVVIMTVNNKRKNKNSTKASAAPTAAASAADAADLRANELKKFYLYFEKKDYSAEEKKMRRLEITIENGVLNIKLDDLPEQRKYESSIDIVKDHVNEFEAFIRKLESAKIFNSQKRHSSGSISRRFMIVSGNRYFSQTFADNNTTSDYQIAEEELNYMMRSIGFISSVTSREDAEREALEFFNNGQSDYENFRGNPGNLRKAVKYYDAAIRIYEQFSPPHKNLEVARSQKTKAVELLKKEVRICQEEFNRAFKLDDVGRMKAALHKIRELTNPESKAYREASSNLQLLNRRTKSGRR